MGEFSREDDFLDIGLDAAAMAAMEASVAIGPLAAASPKFVRSLQKHCPVKTAASFAGLLLRKELQSNCMRLEVLVHLALSHAKGVQPATRGLLNLGFNEVGQQCGYLEDPREDVFVGGIYSKRGNYRVLEGIWEASTFYLQRFVNMVDELPEDGAFKQIADAVHALLKLSDAVCERADLSRNEIGPDGRNRILPPHLVAPDRLAQLISFTQDDLRSLELDLEDLIPFMFDPRARFSLRKQAICNTSLEASPVLHKDGVLFLLLPTAVSVAVRRFFLSALGDGGNRDIFLHQMGKEYSRLFSSSPFLGKVGPRLRFAHRAYGSVCAIGQKVDVGRYLSAVFFLDDLTGFESYGFGGVFRGNPELLEGMSNAIGEMQEGFERNEDFKEGVVLVIGCGVGRGVVLEGVHKPRNRWVWEFVSSPDLISLSTVDGINPLDLFRVLRMEMSLSQMGVSLQNMNGLLNLFAWIESLEGHLVPHAEMPKEFLPGESKLLMPITQNGLGDLRHRLALKVDQHVAQFVDRTWLMARREGASFFEEDAKRPLYVHFDMAERRRLLGFRATHHRSWWYEAVSREGVPNKVTYERWAMMGVWMARIVDEIDKVASHYLSQGPILWRCVFDGGFKGLDVDSFGDEADLLDAFKTTIDTEDRTIEIRVGAGFDRAIYHPHNIAEVGLVRAFLIGVKELCGVQLPDLDSVLQDKLSDVHARHCHVFSARSFRDYFRESISTSPLTINTYDDALLKLGLGWRVRDPRLGGNIAGKQECLKFVNDLVAQLQQDLTDHINLFERESLLRALLENYEAASHSRDWWHRTAAAVLALREDKREAMDAMTRHESKLNGALQPSRNLIEVVLCESPLGRGMQPGDLDVSLLMAQAAQIFHLSGWSDLIRWDLLEPDIVIRPLGDVHARHDFMDVVMDPFGKASSEHRYTSSVKGYAKSLATASPLPLATNTDISRTFLSAWEDEFGVPLDAFRRFMDALEDVGLKEQQMIFIRSRSQLLLLAETPEVGAAIIDSIQLSTRPQWSRPPEGYTWKDISPSRFRRRLGLLRRPLIMLEPGDDARYLVDPALVREGFVSMFRNFYEGSYSDEHLGPSMSKYAGEARERDGAEFNERVAVKMEALGWCVHREIKVTKILNKGLDRNYGDVDVLAWHLSSGRVLVIECKDLQFKKTYGEIAEQLSNYRGWASDDGKKRDSLRKHLDRMEVLRAHSGEVARFLKVNREHHLESLLVFSHPVPMMFAGGLGKDAAKVHTYDTLESV